MSLSREQRNVLWFQRKLVSKKLVQSLNGSYNKVSGTGNVVPTYSYFIDDFGNIRRQVVHDQLNTGYGISQTITTLALVRHLANSLILDFAKMFYQAVAEHNFIVVQFYIRWCFPFLRQTFLLFKQRVTRSLLFFFGFEMPVTVDKKLRYLYYIVSDESQLHFSNLLFCLLFTSNIMHWTVLESTSTIGCRKKCLGSFSAQWLSQIIRNIWHYAFYSKLLYKKSSASHFSSWSSRKLHPFCSWFLFFKSKCPPA